MNYGDVRDDWKLQAIENKAQQAMDKANEIDSLRSNVDRLECSYLKLSAELDELRHELQGFKDSIRQATGY
jgi:uncharacterized coiled-coil DUF342 family protein